MLTILIDGNFLAQRIRAAAELTFLKNPEKDKAALIKACTQALSNDISMFNGSIENVVMCRDWGSWRKQFTQTYPLESAKTNEQQVYKQNREGDKPYDAQKFYAAYDEWCQLLEDKLHIPIFRTKGAEADDMVFIASTILQKKGKQVICYSSDGDFYQFVNKNVCLIKLPKKELFFSRDAQEQVSETKDLNSIFGKKPSNFDRLKQMFAKDAVKHINPVKSVVVKVISGDAKDNTPPIFFWKSSTGKRTFKPSVTHITKAFAKIGIDFDTITEDALYSKDTMLVFIEQLLTVTKQTRDIEHTYKVYLSNMKMKHLTTKHIPEDILRNAVAVWNEKTKLQPQNVKLFNNSNDMLAKFGMTQGHDYFAQFDLTKIQ